MIEKVTVMIVKPGVPKIGTIIVLDMGQFGFIVQSCIEKMQME